MTIIPAQSRAARGLLDWSLADLGDRTNLTESTIRGFESGQSPLAAEDLCALRAAFEAGGVEFIPEDSEGAGVRLKEGKPAQTIPLDELDASNDE